MRESRTPGSARGAGGNSRPYRDNHIGPEFMRRVPARDWRSVDRGTCRPAIERRKILRGADAV